MTAIRKEGKITENISLIDSGMNDVTGLSAVYLVKAGKSCLIDGGTREGVTHVIKTLKEMGDFPPDYVVITHPHWDHVQGIPELRKEAMKEQKSFEVLANEKAIPLLEDQSFNVATHPKDNFENILNVSPLKSGDIIDLEGITLKVIDVPGHLKDHIAFFDETNKIIFPGDSMGIKYVDGTYLPSFMPPFWKKEDYFSSLDKLKEIDFEGICLSHYGYIHGEEVKLYLDEFIAVCDEWWNILEKAEKYGKLEKDYLIETIFRETSLTRETFNDADFKLKKTSVKMILGLINTFRKIARKNPKTIGDVMFPDFIDWTIAGYKSSKGLE
ncbi:MAG: MBL fold metallo-hydrolase [Candidatus Hodarchaeales archaeon]|jgi:glyoxylase-like metal-dependent hydrolase (beta-lactamase superfamily II)